jgi:ribonucleotide reductase alpha subunit
MTLKKIPIAVMDVGADAAQCLRAVVEAYTEYKIVAEQEQTKRREIEKWEKEAITSIQAQRDILIKYLDRSFDERAETFRILFSIVDQAMNDGNNEQLGAALDSITKIAQSSPFKDLADLASVRAALDDPEHEWTF